MLENGPEEVFEISDVVEHVASSVEQTEVEIQVQPNPTEESPKQTSLSEEILSRANLSQEQLFDDPAEEAVSEKVNPEKVNPSKADSKKVKSNKVISEKVDSGEKTISLEEPEKEDSQKTEKQAVTAQSGFHALALSSDVMKAVETSGYTVPTEIQTQIIPHMLEGRDVLAQSQTGTGKTAAFALPILSTIKLDKKKTQVLVLAPTRELAIQVSKSFSTYGAGLKKLAVTTIYGGQDYELQFKQLRKGVHVVVGTPGRVIDHIKRGTLDLSGIRCLVLDEADEMLNMGFLEDVEFVLEKTPEDRQVALFSATLPKPIRNIAERYLKEPARITVKNKTMTADSIRQRAVFVAPRGKIDVLTRFLEAEATDGVLVFTKTKDSTVTVAEKLNQKGLSVAALNGDMPQRTRERTIERLKSGHLNIVVATDVAARGLDVTRVSHVFNYDLPDGSESYIHRIGRTGRAGRKGEAIIFLTKTQGGKLRYIEKATKQPIEVVKPPTVETVRETRIERFQEQIKEVIAKDELGPYKKMLKTFSEKADLPMEVIAAALAKIGQPIFEPEQSGRRKNKGEQIDTRDERPKFDRNDFSKASNPRRGAGGFDRQTGPPESGMNRYRISVGKRDGVKPGNIVGAVANEAGIDGEDIGPIKIHESYSTIDLPEGMPKEIHDTLQETRVVGRQLKLCLASEESDSKSPRHNRRPHDKSRNGKRGAKGFAGKKSFGGKHKKHKAKA